MAYTLGNKCAKNLCKRTVLHQLIIKNVVTCFFWNTVYITEWTLYFNGHFAHLPSHYWTSHSPGQTLRGELFVVLRQLSGTCCLRQ